jgi:small-conductance mechanosensitive channel
VTDPAHGGDNALPATVVPSLGEDDMHVRNKEEKLLHGTWLQVELMRTVLVVAAAIAAGWLVGWLIGVLVGKAARGRLKWLLMPTYRACRRLTVLVLVLIALYFTLQFADLPADWLPRIRQALRLASVLATARLVVKALRAAEELALRELPEESKDPTVRRLRTEVRLFRRLVGSVITVLAIGWALTTVSALRTFGISLLTSAGVVGIIVGLAARHTLGNIFAGLQVALAHMLAVDDVVVVNDEWGRVEDVKLTHVLVRMWDERRLTVPTTYFTERPFQNWTRWESRVIGEVALYLDHTARLGELRSEAQRILEESRLWDRGRWQLQLVDMTPQAVVVQMRAWAPDAASAWDLRCELREGLLDFVRDQHPQWLPRTRGEYHQ